MCCEQDQKDGCCLGGPPTDSGLPVMTLTTVDHRLVAVFLPPFIQNVI